MGDRHFLDDLRAQQARQVTTVRRALGPLVGDDRPAPADVPHGPDELQLRLLARTLIGEHAGLVDQLELAHAAVDFRSVAYRLGGRWVETAAAAVGDQLDELIHTDETWHAEDGSLSTAPEQSDRNRRLRSALVLLELAQVAREASPG